MLKLCALWVKKDKNNNPMMSGKLGENTVLVFKNTQKKEEKHPDYILYLAETQKEKSQEEPGEL